MRTLLALVLALLIAPLSAYPQSSPKCPLCGDTGVRACEAHASYADAGAKYGFYTEWAKAKFPCCALLGVMPCSCGAKPTSAEAVDAEQRYKAARDFAPDTNSKGALVYPSLTTLQHTLPGTYLGGCSRQFFVLSGKSKTELKAHELRALEPELKELSALLPLAVNADKVMEPHEWVYLYLYRAEKLRDAFHDLTSIPQVEISARDGLLKSYVVVDTAAATKAFRAAHSDRSSVPERCLLDLDPETSHDDRYGGTGYPSDAYARAWIAYSIAGTALDRYFVSKKCIEPQPPHFIAIGLARVFECVSTGRCALTWDSPEVGKPAKKGWLHLNWGGEFYKLLMKKRDLIGVSQLFRMSNQEVSTSFNASLTAYCFTAFLLQRFAGDSFVRWLDAMRELSPGEAVAKELKVSETQVETAFYDWIRKNNGQFSFTLQKPPKVAPVEAKLGPSVIQEFKNRWPERAQVPLDAVIADIDALRQASADDACPLLFKVFAETDPASDSKSERLIDSARRTFGAVAQASQSAAATRLRDRVVELMAISGKSEERDRQLESLMHVARYCLQSESIVAPAILDLLASQELRLSSRAKAESLRALGELKSARAATVLTNELKAHGDFESCYEAGVALSKIPGQSAKNVAVDLLKDDSWHLRLAAIQILRRTDDWSTIPDLIEQLSKESGRLKEDILETLSLLVGTSSRAPISDPDAKHWSQWWADIGSKSRGRTNAPSEAAAETSVPDPKSLRLFPPIYSKQVFFAIDISRSMNERIHAQPPPGGAPIKPADQFHTKSEYVIQQLKTAILDEVEPDAEFNVCTFAIRPNLWNNAGPQVATKGNKELVCQWLDKIIDLAEEQTNLERLFDRLFDEADKGFKDRTNKSVYDQIYLVTDGVPTAGNTDSRSLLATVARRNRQHHIRIDVIVVEALDTNLRFLDDLAAQNFGTCTIVKDPFHAIKRGVPH
jgi:hypothetical protein